MTRISFKARLISSEIIPASRFAQSALISASFNVRSRLLLGASALTPVQGVCCNISRSTAKLNILRTIFRVWFDTLAIPADAPNPAGAYAFINHVLRPEVMAGISNTVHYANAVPQSLPMLAPAVRDDPAVYPPAEISAKFFTVTAISAEGEAARARLWARIRTKP